MAVYGRDGELPQQAAAVELPAQPSLVALTSVPGSSLSQHGSSATSAGHPGLGYGGAVEAAQIATPESFQVGFYLWCHHITWLRVIPLLQWASQTMAANMAAIASCSKAWRTFKILIEL